MAPQRVGSKVLQVYGFLFIAFCFTLLAVLFVPLKSGSIKSTEGLFVIYCLLLFSLSYGPNLTTFILPGNQLLKFYATDLTMSLIFT